MATVEYKHASRIFDPGKPPAVSQLDLSIRDGELLVLVGPSGSGKSTAMRMLAGLEPVDEGAVFIDGRDVTGTRARDRDVAMVFQSYALYPNMTARQNMSFALENEKLDRAEIEQRVERAAAMLELGPLMDKRPAAMSGGQRQRVAMGRSIVRNPKVWCMDEPLSNLDATLRVSTRAQIADLQRELGVTTIYVTHDQVEAMTMGDRVAVLKDGHLVQVDTPRNLYDHPNSEFVAGFIGSPAMNLFRVPVEGDHLTLGSMKLSLTRDQCQAITGDSVTVGIRSEDLLPASDGHGLPIAVEMVEELGADAYVYGHLAPLTAANTVVRVEPSAAAAQGYPDEDAPPSPVVLRAEGRTPPAVGATVWVAPVAERIHFFDANGGRRLPD